MMMIILILESKCLEALIAPMVLVRFTDHFVHSSLCQQWMCWTTESAVIGNIVLVCCFHTNFEYDPFISDLADVLVQTFHLHE